MSVDRSHAVGVSRLALGVTHDQHSVDPWGDPQAVARGKHLLGRAFRFENQYVYGWGTVNPEPSRGVFDWSSLDRRVRLMRSTHATIVLTLCCAPDWMTRLGTPTSTYPNLAPTPAHYADFAELARRIALRYPDARYFQVWSELKDFWDARRNRWDVAAYTRLYNAVYDALKGVRRSIRVGGPYLVLEGSGTATGEWYTARPPTPRDAAAIGYWLRHKHGADFLAVDRTVVDDHDPGQYDHDAILGLTHWFGDLARVLRRRTRLPVWFSEDYGVGDPDWAFQAAEYASILRSELLGGARVSLHWGPEADRDAPYGGNDRNLFSSTLVRGGGRPFPTYAVYRLFHDSFPPGTRLYRVHVSSSAVEALASRRATLLLNRRAVPVAVRLGARTLRLAPYEVELVRRR